MDLLPFLEEFQMLARNGLVYATNPYDRERYQRLLELTCRLYGEALDLPPAILRQQFTAELGHITPKIGANAAIFTPTGEILLMLRADTGRWCLPGGWLDAGESPQEAVIREVREETGLTVTTTQLVDVFTRRPSATAGVHTVIGVVYLCMVQAGHMQNSHESRAVHYWPLDAVPSWAGDHQHWAHRAFTTWRREQVMSGP